FFQAEDGIRDATVTGVQTCALPISRSLAVAAGPPAFRLAVRASLVVFGGLVVFGAPAPPFGRAGLWRATAGVGGAHPSRRGSSRSEERRVGKECGSRWGWW